MQFQIVTQNPSPAIRVGRSGLVTGGNVQAMLNAVAGTQYQAWVISIDIGCGTDGTTAANSTMTVTLTVSLHFGGLVLIRQHMVWGGVSGNVFKTLTHDMRGYTLPQGDGFDVALTATSPGFIARASGMVTYSVI